MKRSTGSSYFASTSNSSQAKLTLVANIAPINAELFHVHFRDKSDANEYQIECLQKSSDLQKEYLSKKKELRQQQQELNFIQVKQSQETKGRRLNFKPRSEPRAKSQKSRGRKRYPSSQYLARRPDLAHFGEAIVGDRREAQSSP